MGGSKLPQFDLDKCIHCGLCLNACPTYRELGLEMDSPRGRVYQMVQVAAGAMEAGPEYERHLDLCLACRGCESACPSGVPYGRLIEAARTELEERRARPWQERLLRAFVFGKLLKSRALLRMAGTGLWLYSATGVRRLVRRFGLPGKLGRIEHLAPTAERPFFFDQIGKTLPAYGERRGRVALVAGCLANFTSARLNEATVEALRRNGCEVVIPKDQTCCGALHAHAGETERARALARQNIDVFQGLEVEAFITNAAGCGSTLKEYDHLLAGDARYAEKARAFVRKMKDVCEYLASRPLNPNLAKMAVTVTYQDSCHLAHGQKIRSAPRELLQAIPGVQYRELPLADLCCGSAGTYNIVHDELADSLLRKKMELINASGAEVVTSANVGCAIQLEAGVQRYGARPMRVMHVVELLAEAYRRYSG